MDSSISTSCNSFRRTDILRKILLKSSSSLVESKARSPEDARMNPLIPPNLHSGVLISSASPANAMSIPHNLVTHNVPSMKNQAGNPYPLQLHLGATTTVNVPVQLASSTNINVPVQLGAPPLQLSAPVSLPANIPVQLPGGAAVNVPLQFPTGQGQILPSMPLLQTSAAQPFNSSIIHVHVGANASRPSTEALSDAGFTTVSTPAPSISTSGTIQVTNGPLHMLSGGVGVGGMRSNLRVPQVVYINPGAHKPVTTTNTITNPKQIIVRRPVSSTSGIQFVSNVNAKSNIAPKVNIQKTSILTSGNTAQPIVIQKPKMNANMVPVSIATNAGNKQAYAYLGSVKKPVMNKVTESQSILLPNNQVTSNPTNQQSSQKLFLTPMNMPKIQNTKYILPVTLPGAMATKGPIINLQISNGQIQNDHQGNITVMRETIDQDNTHLTPMSTSSSSVNGHETMQTSRSEKSFTLSIPGSRAEPTGEQEYSLSIPETNASMNDDIYTVSIADEDESQEKSFTLAIPEKGKSLLSKTLCEKNESSVVPAPAILRRSNSDNIEKRSSHTNLKRRISLCTEKVAAKKHIMNNMRMSEQNYNDDSDNNDEHEIPSLFCDEKLDKDLEAKANPNDKSGDVYRDKNITLKNKFKNNTKFVNYQEIKKELKPEVELIRREGPSKVKKDRQSMDSASEEDPPGLLWNSGVAQLLGSSIHFQTNEFGLIDVMDSSDQENNGSHSKQKYKTPLNQRIEDSNKKRTSPEDLYCCDGCGCHGMASDFITPNYCSLTCKQVCLKLAPKKKVDKDSTEIHKRRNKMKKILQAQRQEPTADKPPIPEQTQPAESDSRLNPILLKAEKEETFENKKYPWVMSNGFSWTKYLEFCNAKAAPIKAFIKDPFPVNPVNGFKMGMKLEAIDPMAAIFSVVTVVETQGYRMRLHFDSYPDMYDYWVNADSIDIFPPGWCERNGRVLKPPQGYTTTSFNWGQYLKQCKSLAAPRHLFPHLCQAPPKPTGFRVGMKLEAEDRKDKLICVASVADVLDNRLLITFDSWAEKYDYWVDPTSPHIHPVGWAEENGHSLTPPNFFEDPDSFTWEDYLRQTSAVAAPARLFRPRSPHSFKVGMKMEVVDIRVPFLIRVASVAKCTDHALLVSYDGWPSKLDVWLDDDSADLHPVGWCLRTGHPLEPPLTQDELSKVGVCGMEGCRGLGSLRGGSHKTHSAAIQCPYRVRPVSPAPAERLQCSAPFATHLLPRTRTVLNQPKNKQSSDKSEDTHDTHKDKDADVRPAKHRKVEVAKSEQLVLDEDSTGSVGSGGSEGRAGEEAAPPLAAPRPRPACLDVARALRTLLLPPDPLSWTQEDVRAFVSLTCAEAGAQLWRQRVGGAELLMLSQEEMVRALGLKLGPAIKIYGSVLQLRERLRRRGMSPRA